MRNIFDQGLNMNCIVFFSPLNVALIKRINFFLKKAFSTFVVLASGSTEVFSTKGGNTIFVQSIINSSNADVNLNSKVVSLTRIGNQYQIEYVSSNSKNHLLIYLFPKKKKKKKIHINSKN